MPVDIQCTACRCRFSLGGFHYHGQPDGYEGATLAVCRACGTPHCVERAASDRGPPAYPVLRVSVNAVPPGSRVQVAKWLRRDKGLSTSEAMELTRRPPFVVRDDVHEPEAVSVRQELDSLGAVTGVERVGERVNTWFGPLRRDRLSFAAAGPSADAKPTWQASPVEIARRELEHIACARCLVPGTLTELPGDLDVCPACKQATLVESGFWIT